MSRRTGEGVAARLYARSHSRLAQDCHLLRSVRRPVPVSLRPRRRGPVLVVSPKLNRLWIESDTADVHGGLPVVPNLRRDRRKLVMMKEEHGICSSKLSRRSSEGLIGSYNGQISSNELLRGDHLLDGFIANRFRIELTLDDNASTATLSNHVRALIAAALRHLG